MKTIRLVAILLAMSALATGASAQIQALISPIETSIPELKYPRLAQVAGIEGAVILTLTVEKGQVTKTDAKFGMPILAEAAQENARLWKFAPGFSGQYEIAFVFYIQGVADQKSNIPKEGTRFTAANQTLFVISERPWATPATSSSRR